VCPCPFLDESNMERARALLPALFDLHNGSPFAKVEGMLAQRLIDEGTLKPDAQELAACAMREWMLASARATKAPRVLHFFSQSKDVDDLFIELPAWRKILSNFCESPVVADGRSFPSVEHYYQGAKFTLAGEHERGRAFECGGAVGRAALAAKKAGGRRGFEAERCQLDFDAWGKISDGVMWRALQCRACSDEAFSRILREVHAQSVTLLHFERSGAGSYWGGNVSKETGKPQGGNRLGEMLMRLAAMIAADGGVEALRAQCRPEVVLSPEQRLAAWAAAGAIPLASGPAKEEEEPNRPRRSGSANPGPRHELTKVS